MQSYLAVQLVCHLQAACKAHRLCLYLSRETPQQDCELAPAPVRPQNRVVSNPSELLHVCATKRACEVLRMQLEQARMVYTIFLT